MAEKDRLYRFLFEHSHVRGEFVRLDESWNEVLKRHDYPPVIQKLLGEACAASVLLSATIKFRGSMTLQIQGDGPVSLLVVQVGNDRTFRAVAEYEEDVPDTTLDRLFANGRLVITIEPKEMGERYQGIVELGNAGLQEALDGYFAQSEQLKTRLWLSANAEHAAGLLMQELPRNAKQQDEEEDQDTWNRVIHLSATLTPGEMYSLSVVDILHRLFHEEEVRLFDPEVIGFSCTCSRERVENTLRSLGYEELQDILQEQGLIGVDCSFCNQHYEFDKVDVEQIFAPGISPEVPKTTH